MTYKKGRRGAEMTTQHNTCTSCFYSTRFSGIEIEQNGKCNHCNSNDFATASKATTTSDLTELHIIAEQLKKKRQGQYDCIIGASGGLDSSYVIYIAKRILDLNPLVVSYDHGFTYDITKNNLKTICRKLEIDLRFICSGKQYDRKYVKSWARAVSPIDYYWGLCAFCWYVLPASVYRCASKEKISTELTSFNIYENRVDALQRGIWARLLKQARHDCGLLRLPKILFHMAIARYYLFMLKLEIYVPPPSNLIGKLIPRSLERIDITKYVRWDIDKMVETLQKEVGWKTPEHPRLPMRFDCEIEDSFLNHTVKKATGLTAHGIICNYLIHDGIRTKSQLKDAVEYYDNLATRKKEEMMIRLNLK